MDSRLRGNDGGKRGKDGGKRGNDGGKRGNDGGKRGNGGQDLCSMLMRKPGDNSCPSSFRNPDHKDNLGGRSEVFAFITLVQGLTSLVGDILAHPQRL